MPLRSQAEYIVSIAEFPGIYFQQMTGGARSNEVTRVHPGGRPGSTKNIYGRSSVEDITITKSYDPVTDLKLLAWDKAWSRGVRRPLTIVKQPVTAAGIPDGPPETYLRCGRVNFTPPDTATESAEDATLSITLAPEDVQ